MQWIAMAALGVVTCFPSVPCLGQDSQNKNLPGNAIQHTYSLSGPEMYRTWCASCHGTDGKGNGPVAGALRKAPTNLTLLSKKNSGKFPTERVREYIDGRGASSKNQAHGTREMPVWGEALASIDASAVGISFRVNTLTSYLETLQEK